MPVSLSNAVLIREATQSDVAIIYDFLCMLEETRFDLIAFQQVFNHNLTSTSVHYLVAELAGEVVGFVSCHVQQLLHHVGKVGEIQELFVRPDVRNQRIGHQLVEALTTLAIQENFVNLEVTTNQKRADTVRFYEREAFTKTHFKLVKPIQT
ncbi:GNAT family N-acetyltransferase [Spirosoma sp. BT702]|uniref:GNAT family N-acetyltransferase n=1 Tax=Spirosoma profusum TaxID=2771354 RepID=A0A926Y1F6_9BACT|nr:GNAT family N-acetyltransferase [Spirosoma profusum]MBD2701793.1 GNAT family N-acetyltransferase [Spirosoma profusum]